MQDNTQQTLDMHKMQLVAGLGAVAESLRQTATLAENFSTYLQQTSFVPHSQASASGNTGSGFPMNMFPMFFGGGMGMTNGHQQHGGQLMSPVDTKMEEGEGDGKKRKRGRAAADDKDKKGKKAKDMFAPKRPPSAYLLFQNEVRKGMQQKYPGLAYSEVLGKVSEKWSTLTPEQKLVYESVTKAAKEQYISRKKAYEDAVSSGMSNEDAHKLAEAKYPDPVPDVVVPEKMEVESDEEASEEPSPVVPVAESSTDSDSDEEETTKTPKAKDDSDSGSEDEDEEEEPKAPPPKKQKAQEKNKTTGSAAEKAKPAAKEKETKKREYKKKDKKDKKDD